MTAVGRGIVARAAGVLGLIGWIAIGAAAAAARTDGTRTSPPNGRSGERSLPSRWDLKTGAGVRWTADLGTETYGGPVIAAGKVFVGTNNGKPRNPAVTGDRGIVMAFGAADGAFLWQAVHDKLPQELNADWPQQGVCSTPAVAGDRLYYLSNRGELVAADTEGFLDGENDGPFRSETRSGKQDADLVWVVDLRQALGVRPAKMASSSPLVVGDRVFVGTSNGAGTGGKVAAPEAPSLIAVERATGKVLWADASPGGKILDGQWSSPSLGRLGGVETLLFPAGDGWLYAFDPATGRRLWAFDAGAPLDVAAGGPRDSLIAAAVIAADRAYIGIGQDPERGAGKGRLWALAPKGTTAVAPAWSLSGDAFSRTLSTVAVAEGLVYAADLNGFLRCLDAATGKVLWEHDSFAAVWGSPLVADGKVYLGDEDGDVAVLRAGRTKQLLAEINLGNAVYTSAAARDGVLYLATRSRLFALSEPPGPPPAPPAGR